MNAMSRRRITARRVLSPFGVIGVIVIAVVTWQLVSSLLVSVPHLTYHPPTSKTTYLYVSSEQFPFNGASYTVAVPNDGSDTDFGGRVAGAWVWWAIEHAVMLLAWLLASAVVAGLALVLTTEAVVGISVVVVPPAAWHTGDKMAGRMARAGALLAGGSHAYLLEAWLGDLRLESGHQPLTRWRATVLGSGYLLAGAKIRARHLGDVALRPVDWLVATKPRARVIVASVVVLSCDFMVTRDGLDGLIGSADGLAVVTGIVSGAVEAYRRVRGLKQPDRQGPNKKAAP